MKSRSILWLLRFVWLAGFLLLLVGGRIVTAQGKGGGSVTATAGAPTPDPVAAGTMATCTLDATNTPPTAPYTGTLSGPVWTWAVSGDPGDFEIIQPDPSSPAATLQATFSSPETYTVTAAATATWTSSDGDVITLWGSTDIIFGVGGVDKLQYGEAVDIDGTLYVLVGQSVTFTAVPSRYTPFPSGQPVWSGSSGASGTGDTVTVTFNTLSSSTSDCQTVVATCGNTSVTANVIVFDLTPILTPDDNFDGRDLDAYGVCEIINLSYSTTPSGINEYDLGGLQWQIDSGGGDVSARGGTGTYQCPDVAASVVLGLLITGGPMLGEERQAAQEVVAPNGVKVLQMPDTTVYHANPDGQGRCSVGFCGYIYVTCPNGKVVSFQEIVVREGECVSTATGFYKDRGWDNLPHEKSDNWSSLLAFVADKGYQSDVSMYVRKYDKINAGFLPAPYAVGTFNWPIPEQYKKKGELDDTAKLVATSNQYWESDDQGKCTIRKAGSGDFPKNAMDAQVIPAGW